LDDLVQAGVLGLIDAANKFDSKKHVAFSSYAKHRMRGAMQDSLRRLDGAATDALAAILRRAPTAAEVAEKMNITIDRWHRIMLNLRNCGTVSASSRANENDDLPAPDFPGALETQPDSICAHQQLRGMLEEATNTLPERCQKVVVLYYAKEMTMKEIGGVLGINESRVSQIHKTALHKMANILHNNGIDSVHAF
jgi:RNA polymerase sigma factor FliA